MRSEENRRIFLLTPPLLTPHFLLHLTSRFFQSQPTDPALVGVAGLAGAGDVAMIRIAADVGSDATKTACSVHSVIVKVAPLPEQAHVAARLLVGLLVQLGGEHEVDSHVPELLPQVEIS